MNKLYILTTIYDDDLMDKFGEAQFAFNENLECIGWWDNNDADFRCDYFSPMMETLGYQVIEEHPQAKKLITKEAKKHF